MVCSWCANCLENVDLMITSVCFPVEQSYTEISGSYITDSAVLNQTLGDAREIVTNSFDTRKEKIIPERKGELFISVNRLLRCHQPSLQSATNGS